MATLAAPPPSVGSSAPSDSFSMISADLADVGSSFDSGKSSSTVSPEVNAEIDAIPDGDDVEITPEVEIEADETSPALETKPEVADDDAAKPEIENLSQARWKRVHSAYKYAQDLGKALGVVGEDGRVDLSLFPAVEEVQGMKQAYSDRMAMEHDFASADPSNAEQWIENWHSFSPQGMGTVAAQLPEFLAKKDPQAYTALATPIVARVMEHMYSSGAGSEDPAMRNYLLNAARAVEWWVTGGPNGGNFRPDDQIFNRAPNQQPQQRQGMHQQAPQMQNQPRSAAEAELAQIRQQTAQAKWEGYFNEVRSDIGAEINPEIDKALKPLKDYFPNDFQYGLARDKFIQTYNAQLNADAEGMRQWNIALERAQRQQTPESRQALAKIYSTMSRKAINAVRVKFISDASKGIKAASDARHQQLTANQGKKGITTPGTPQQQSIATAPQKRRGETGADFLKRQVLADIS